MLAATIDYITLALQLEEECAHDALIAKEETLNDLISQNFPAYIRVPTFQFFIIYS